MQRLEGEKRIIVRARHLNPDAMACRRRCLWKQVGRKTCRVFVSTIVDVLRCKADHLLVEISIHGGTKAFFI